MTGRDTGSGRDLGMSDGSSGEGDQLCPLRRRRRAIRGCVVRAAAALREMSPRLPWLRHRMVLGARRSVGRSRVELTRRARHDRVHRRAPAQGQQTACAVVQPTPGHQPAPRSCACTSSITECSAGTSLPGWSSSPKLPRDREDGLLCKDFLRRWLQGQSMLDDASVARNEAL